MGEGGGGEGGGGDGSVRLLLALPRNYLTVRGVGGDGTGGLYTELS